MSYARFAIRPGGDERNLILGINKNLFKEGHLYEVGDYYGLGELTIKDLGKSVATVRYDHCSDKKPDSPLPDFLEGPTVNWAWEAGAIIQSGDHLFTLQEYTARLIKSYVESINSGGSPENIPESIKKDVLALAKMISK